MITPIIVNWLITRKCNIRCKFCNIIKNVSKYSRELSYQNNFKIIDFLSQMNPKPFIILYGGEPLLYKDLGLLITHLNERNLPYTIITNASMMDKVEFLIQNKNLRGLSVSVDPLVFDVDLKRSDPDRYFKSKLGFDSIIDLKRKYPHLDCVAEITVDAKNVFYLRDLLDVLDSNDIYSSITTIESKFGKHYDFASEIDDSLLIKPETNAYYELKSIIEDINSGKYSKIHFPELLNVLLQSLPNNFYCGLEPHNLTVDCDGEIRLCLRIHGDNNPNILDYVDKPVDVFIKDITEWMQSQKDKCKGCAWTCVMMTKLAYENTDLYKRIVHEKGD